MRVQLTGGAYQSASLIASAQKCINLIPEAMPAGQGEPTRMTHYSTPGLLPLCAAPNGGPIRGMYSASNEELYVVSGQTVYFVDSLYNFTVICTLETGSGYVSMADNGITLIVVDGSKAGDVVPGAGGGFAIDLATRVATWLGTGSGGNLGAQRVDYLSTFFIFNQPFTPNFFVSRALSTTFDPLDFAAKSTASDYLVAQIVCRGQLWLIGQKTTEIWTISGATDFQFQYLQGALIEHGCQALGSVAKADGQVYWLSRDMQGKNVVMRGAGLQATRISTHGIEAMLTGVDATDATAFCYQLRGHVIYALTVGDLTVAYDEATTLWHQWATYSGGVPHRHRAGCFAFWRQLQVVGDWENGNIYALNPTTYTDNGAPIMRVRSFPHIIDDDQRLHYQRFVADMDVGTGNDAASVSMRFSDDRGVTYGTPLTLPLGSTSQTNRSLQFRRLGLARDRVFEVSWAANRPVALNGAFIDVEPCVS